MQPATANPMLQRHAFLWQRLRGWLAEALHNHANSLEYRARDQLIPLRIWLTLIENLLRRLILMAASTEKVDVMPQWSPAPKPEPCAEPETQPDTIEEAPTEPEPTRKPNTSRFRFRLYGIHWPRKAGAETNTTFTGAAPPTATCTRALITIRIDIRDPLLHVGERPQRRTKSRARSAKRPATKRIRATKLGPDLTPDDFIALVHARDASGSSAEQAWLEMQTDIARQNRAYLAELQSLANEANKHWRDDESAERIDDSEVEPAASPAQPEPELIGTQPLMDRLAILAELINNPEKLIQRAARLFARRREIALKLSGLAKRKETGLLANSRHLYGTLIPLDAEFRLAMEYFAASYVEDDSS